jgi:hypothetical protein
MEFIDEAVQSFLRQDGEPLPRITLGAVNRDGMFHKRTEHLATTSVTISRNPPLREVFRW